MRIGEFGMVLVVPLVVLFANGCKTKINDKEVALVRSGVGACCSGLEWIDSYLKNNYDVEAGVVLNGVAQGLMEYESVFDRDSKEVSVYLKRIDDTSVRYHLWDSVVTRLMQNRDLDNAFRILDLVEDDNMKVELINLVMQQMVSLYSRDMGRGIYDKRKGFVAFLKDVEELCSAYKVQNDNYPCKKITMNGVFAFSFLSAWDYEKACYYANLIEDRVERESFLELVGHIDKSKLTSPECKGLLMKSGENEKKGIRIESDETEHCKVMRKLEPSARLEKLKILSALYDKKGQIKKKEKALEIEKRCDADATDCFLFVDDYMSGQSITRTEELESNWKLVNANRIDESVKHIKGSRTKMEKIMKITDLLKRCCFEDCSKKSLKDDNDNGNENWICKEMVEACKETAERL